MQPEQPSAAQWEDIRTALFWLFAVVGLVILFAGSLLAGLAIVPSTVATGTLPEKTRRIRPVLLGFAVLALIGAVIASIMLAINVTVIFDLYEKVWI